ncbi:diaminopimelate epimerase [Singulisphaera acidiphila]|uniref:Diaminopimelate epimerase n=1 Tax=Singulisphaera acidiphila (strain ATCC BAA-1392 / DSM 18658 / VKM B-2454 / MOB10) TaxID=886293 RepID=L0DF30_SINAD|nr:diaminopimelate epimerase [Singulisphaera acidiphila]AGA27413.1 diaminopimelate epimerase [Singulisphaera acidiphila DSM 18658]
MKFTKMHGLGNDYVYVSTFDQKEPADLGALAIAVSDRHFGIGSDGLIMITPSERADARMRMFNTDGTEGEMCGNGVRCVAKYVHDHGIAPRPRVTIETGRGVLTLDLEVEGGKARRVRVDMQTPILQAAKIPTTLPGEPPIDAPLTIEGHPLGVTAVSMGNPHAVVYVDDVTRFPVERFGPLLENHVTFPKRVNVHFAEVVGPGEVRMRTWERGSGITLACGTGACAVCVAGILTGRTGRKIIAHLPGGDLELEWPGDGQSVFMTGPATEVFSGEWPD